MCALLSLLTADVVLNGAILAVGDDSLSGNLGIRLMLINELRQFMRLIDPAGRGPNRRNDSLGVIDHPVVLYRGRVLNPC